MSDKKFANMHYPGMKTDPNEGHVQINPEAAPYFDSQVLTIGIKNQRKLFSSSIIFLGADALTCCVVKKIFEIGIGRCGVLGDLDSAKILGLPKMDSGGVLSHLSQLKKTTYPWIEFEPFKDESIDRSFEDIVRGFKIAIAVNPNKELIEKIKSHGVSCLVVRAEKNEASFQIVFPEMSSSLLTPRESSEVCGYVGFQDLLGNRVVQKIVQYILFENLDQAKQLEKVSFNEQTLIVTFSHE